jgi:uncharacterized protein YggT (Ycf19 family)
MTTIYEEHQEIRHHPMGERRTVVQEAAPSTRTVIVSRVVQLVWFVTAVIGLLLGTRLVLRMIGANAGADFAELIYRLSQPLVAPFLGMVADTELSPGYFLEWSTLIGLIIYVIVGALLAWLIRVLFAGPRAQRTIRTVKRDIQA